mmetsp:Transcript_7924/g.26420  ORF Transcript_7924/g.26420 Transcript_7924/m.26420 type:complete len:211 (+) Transcript_7924:296-928(+)
MSSAREARASASALPSSSSESDLRASALAPAAPPAPANSASKAEIGSNSRQPLRRMSFSVCISSSASSRSESSGSVPLRTRAQRSACASTAVAASWTCDMWESSCEHAASRRTLRLRIIASCSSTFASVSSTFFSSTCCSRCRKSSRSPARDTTHWWTASCRRRVPLPGFAPPPKAVDGVWSMTSSTRWGSAPGGAEGAFPRASTGWLAS